MEGKLEQEIVGITETAHGITFEHLDAEEAEFLYEEIFVRRLYVSEPVALPADVPGLIVDIGANIGLFSLWCCRNISNCKVIAFEPIPQAAVVAQRNMRGNGFSDRFEIRPSGVADEAGVTTFAYYVEETFLKENFRVDAPGESTRWYRENEWQQEKMKQPARKESWVQAPLVTLKDAVPERISWLKVDAEGDELNILKGAGNLTRISQISAEVRDVDGRLKAFVDLLERNNFEVVAKQQSGGDCEGYRMTIPEELLLFYVYARNRSAEPEESD